MVSDSLRTEWKSGRDVMSDPSRTTFSMSLVFCLSLGSLRGTWHVAGAVVRGLRVLSVLATSHCAVIWWFRLALLQVTGSRQDLPAEKKTELTKQKWDKVHPA